MLSVRCKHYSAKVTTCPVKKNTRIIINTLENRFMGERFEIFESENNREMAESITCFKYFVIALIQFVIRQVGVALGDADVLVPGKFLG